MKELTELLKAGAVWSAERSADLVSPALNVSLSSTLSSSLSSSGTPSLVAFCAETQPEGDPFFPEASLRDSCLRSSFGIEAIDRELPDQGIVAGALHEFAYDEPLFQSARRRWVPPFLPLLPVLARLPIAPNQQILWIGRRCWPTPQLLMRANLIRATECRHFFLDPPRADTRLWSAVQAIQSGSVGAVFIDGHRFSFLSTRKLQIASRVAKTFVFLLRPPWEITSPSAARTRWMISPLASPQLPISYRWTLNLLRARGLRHPLRWTIEWQRARYGEKRFVCLSSELLDRTSEQGTAIGEDTKQTAHHRDRIWKRAGSSV